MGAYKVNDTDLISIADAIRYKTQTSAELAFPTDFVNAIDSMGGSNLKMGVLRSDAEMVKSWSYDLKAVDDLSITIPAYSTTAQTVRASQALSGTYTLNYTDYNYYVLERFLTIPTYNTTSKGKGRVEYHIGSCAYELSEITANQIVALSDPTKKYTSATRGFYATGAWYRSVYWTSGTAITAYSTSAYSTSQIVVAPTISNGAVTMNTPTWSMRGHTTYFTSTYWGAITDIRYQFVGELYRVPKGSMNLNGWGIQQQAYHIINDVNNNNQNLT